MNVHFKYQAANGAVNLHHPPCIGVSEIIRIRTEGSVPERAFLAADLSRGAVRVHGLKKSGMSQALAAVLANSTPLSVGFAVKRMYARESILRGSLPLHPTYSRVKAADTELPPPPEVLEEAVIPECHEPHPTWVQEVEQTAQVELSPPAEKFLIRLARMVGADAWLRAGVAADL